MLEPTQSTSLILWPMQGAASSRPRRPLRMSAGEQRTPDIAVQLTPPPQAQRLPETDRAAGGLWMAIAFQSRHAQR